MTDPARWVDHAACRGTSGHLLPERALKTRHGRVPAEHAHQVGKALAMCAVCPVLEQCRAWSTDGFEDPVPHHIAGGMHPFERMKARRARLGVRGTGPIPRNHGRLPFARSCPCSECLERLRRERRRHADEQARRRQRWADGTATIAHGTYSGYKQHQHAQLPYCEPCRAAYSTYMRTYRAAAKLRGVKV